MSLPAYLKEGIAEHLNQSSLKSLAAASAELTAMYKNPLAGRQGISSEAQRLAYLTVRLPATFEAVASTLQHTLKQIPGQTITSILDLGAGPGTASHAAAALLPDMQRAALVERDSQLISLGKKLTSQAPFQANWIQADLTGYQIEDSFDLVILSYVLNELKPEDAMHIVANAWEKAQVLLIIEPGTPQGFGGIVRYRDWLLQQQARLLAPCPHHLACPMASQGDWCHFYARVERSSEHRRSKQGELGYEDEKFSYIAAGKTPEQLPEARIVRFPEKHSGHLTLTLCQQGQILKETISKKQGSLYKAAKKSDWGAPWEPGRLRAKPEDN